MRVIGLCRFSYPAIGGFKRMHGSVAEREAYLYAPERMEMRFRHFECLTLPSVAAQQDGDFTFLVLTGESLPAPHLERLRDLTAGVPQIRIVQSPPMRQRLAAQIAIKQALGADETESLQFRLDDDDAVAVSFTRSLRWFARQTTAMRRNWRNMAVEYNHGYSVRLSAQGILAETVHAPFWACGLAVLFRPGDARTVMNFAHHRLHREMPTLIHPTPRMFLRGKHEDNDSAATYRTGPMQPLAEEERAFFRSQFNVDEERVRAVFAAPPASGG